MPLTYCAKCADNDPIKINSAASLEKALSAIVSSFGEHKYLEITIRRVAGQRTDKQRKALEVYFRELAAALNDAGLDQRVVLSKMRDGVCIPWRQDTVKENLFRPVMEGAAGKKSTTKLTTEEVGKVYEILNRWTAGTLGVSVPFPERDKD